MYLKMHVKVLIEIENNLIEPTIGHNYLGAKFELVRRKISKSAAHVSKVKNDQKQRIKVAPRIHEKIANARQDYLHKISTAT